MESLGKTLNKCENGIIALCFIVMSLAAFAQVVNRNLIGASISWFDELARYCMVYMTLLATEAGLRDGSQISVSAVIDKCSPAARRILQLIVKLIVIGFSIMIFVTSLTIVQTQINSGQVSAGLGIPMVIPYLALPISFGAIVVVQILSLITMLKTPIPTKESK
ncbi:TRAP transporter small permease [Succinatimonas hippei]|uniref:TRAP transporter small permease protein n=1 Tax=Succinatimonas hippei (strain DSM 22608 / JCM 16073 / KCTC 15190 / YIT 12066) TaxID=762983 RepID=E8LMF2_SUCHY|nr:TRAP transporter small permease [Succinatimonas hippei]EFY06317.1 TRAP transporter, DctQ-like membrane protein [Succinatimonas hippei YIT 12066]MCL1603055.1 TRAP transporter small permease [Succinatimonas hippei]MDM8119468.1 TRAP transporter small permease [Succinatimonas hippei]